MLRKYNSLKEPISNLRYEPCDISCSSMIEVKICLIFALWYSIHCLLLCRHFKSVNSNLYTGCLMLESSRHFNILN